MADLPGGADDLIEAYLDELLLAWRGRPRQARRLLSEAESHLWESVAAGVAAGLSEPEAARQAIRRFGPPAAVARGLPRRAAAGALAGQLTEAALFVLGVLGLATGAAAVPADILGLAGNPYLITGDSPGQALAAGRCQYLLHLTHAPDCAQALSDHHLQEVIRSHALAGWLGVVLFGLWWAVHVHRRSRPPVLTAEFPLTVCSTLLGVVAVFLTAAGLRAAAVGADSIGGVAGSGDIAATGATLLAAAGLCWLILARRATGWPRLRLRQ